MCVCVPALARVVVLRGSADAPVRNVILRGLPSTRARSSAATRDVRKNLEASAGLHFGALWCGCRRRPLTFEHPP